VWALCPAGVVDWRKGKGLRLSRVREQEASALSLPRRPCVSVSSGYPPETTRDETHAHGRVVARRDAAHSDVVHTLSAAGGAESEEGGGRSTDKGAGGCGGEGEGVEKVGGRCVWVMPGRSVDDLGADGLRILVSST